jgi:hypothetical protein
MRVILKRTFLLALSVTLSGCGADLKNERADRKTSLSTAPTEPTKSITAPESSKLKAVGTASISGGKYVASLEGMA